MATSNERAEVKAAAQDKEQPGVRKEPSRAIGEVEQWIFSMRSGTGEVVKIEKVDAAGKRGDVQWDEAVDLAGKQNLDEIDAVLDEAYETGISSVLDPGDDDEEPETTEESQLRRSLLRLIIGRAVRRRLRRRIAQRLVVARTMSRDAEPGLTRKSQA